jgi:acyl carrier protein
VALAEMPRTPDGDIDRQALQAMGRRQTQVATTERAAPETDLERAIAAIWTEALQTEVVSVSDNFFELGGHSILLAQVHGKLCAALDRDLSIVDLFRYPTIRALAAYLGQTQDDKPTYQTVQDRAAKQRVALQRQRQWRRTQ